LDRVLGNRNLTNKLWNAGKFLQMQLADCSESEFRELAAADFSSLQSLADLPLVERWILSALHQVCSHALLLSATELWMICKAVQMQLAYCLASEFEDVAAADSGSEQRLTDLPLVERCILSALHQAWLNCPVALKSQSLCWLFNSH